MAFTDPPRTWTDGELVTASIMNAHVRDQFNALKKRVIATSFGDFAGVALTAGVRGYLRVPFDCTISGWNVIGDSSSGSVVIDVWRTNWAGAVPTSSNTITGADRPTITGAQKAQNLTLTLWATSVTAGDVLAFNIVSVTTFKAVSLTLDATQA